MYCTKCGEMAPTTARFCPACGAAVVDAGTAVGMDRPAATTVATPATSAARPVLGASSGTTGVSPAAKAPRRPAIAVIVGVVILGLIAAAAFFMTRPPQAPPTAAAPGNIPSEMASEPAPAKPSSPVIAGFDWSGLSPEELHEARLALDAAIVKEEQAAASHSKAAPASNTQSTP